MSLLALDLGGTTLSGATFSREGELKSYEQRAIGDRTGSEVGRLIAELTVDLTSLDSIRAAGVSVPGIYYPHSGRVWAPNVSGWENYPLYEELSALVGNGTVVRVDSDRSCYILGETWMGAAQGARDAVYLAVGTGIGAGIMVDGRVVRGARGAAGSAGWMALNRPFRDSYENHGCLEHHASGPGLARVAAEMMNSADSYGGVLKSEFSESPTGREVFTAYRAGDPVACRVMDRAVQLWGMAVANLVSLLDPEVVILGGGVFGPASSLLDRIRGEAHRWAQPVTFPDTSIETTTLDGRAGLYGAARLARNSLSDEN